MHTVIEYVLAYQFNELSFQNPGFKMSIISLVEETGFSQRICKQLDRFLGYFSFTLSFTMNSRNITHPGNRVILNLTRSLWLFVAAVIHEK